MTLLPIRTIGDPVLREACRDVEEFDQSLRTLHADMLETMYKAPGVGLAASQIGLSLRFFVYDPARGAGPGALANASIVAAEGEVEMEEGCLSIPELWAPRTRPAWVRIRGQNLEGESVELEGEDLLARIFQHETDHLNGILFIDHLPDTERRRVMGLLRQRDLAAAVRPGAAGRRADPAGLPDPAPKPRANRSRPPRT